MPRLVDLLWNEENRNTLVQDCAQLIETRVAGRGGLKGIGLKTAFGLLKSLKPDAVPRALNLLLPQFAEALDPMYQEFAREFRHKGGADFSVFLSDHAQRATAAMLGVTDARADASSNARLKNLYRALRSSAEAEVLAVLPGLAKLIGARLG
jgi:hypothetical protein